MSETVNKLPPRLQAIVEDFSMCEGPEKLELLLEFAERLPPLPDWLRDQRDAMAPVPECMTPVFIYAECKDGGLTYYFDIPEESTTVRGYASLLREGVEGASPEAVLQIPVDFYIQMGLHKMLTPQRLNGISAVLAHMKRLAVNMLNT